MSKNHEYDSSNFPISDYESIASTIGMAFFDEFTLEDVWMCIMLSDTSEQFDVAVESQLWLEDLVRRHYGET